MRCNIVWRAWVGALGATLIMALSSLPLVGARAQGPAPGPAPDRGPVTALAWSPDGAQLAIGASRGVWLVEWQAGNPAIGAYLEDSPRETGGVSALAWSPDGARLAGARFDGVIRVWDAASGAKAATLRGHIGAVNGVAWSGDGRFIASAGDDLMVRAWDAASGALLATLDRHSARALTVAFNGDSSRLVSGGADAQVLVWDTAAWTGLGSPQGHREDVEALAFAPDGVRFLSGAADNTARLWRTAGGETLVTFPHPARVIAGGWSGESPVTFAWDGAIRFWDTATPDQPVSVHGGLPERVRAAAFRPDGALLALIESDTRVRLVDSASGEQAAWIDVDGE
ncbi:MAG: WD40 repeat domain-containing protein [Anaerolineae bacterium]|nr:WD40 repeat domain-containing protein [Anaerolineae bacterium]